MSRPPAALKITCTGIIISMHIIMNTKTRTQPFTEGGIHMVVLLRWYAYPVSYFQCPNNPTWSFDQMSTECFPWPNGSFMHDSSFQKICVTWGERRARRPSTYPTGSGHSRASLWLWVLRNVLSLPYLFIFMYVAYLFSRVPDLGLRTTLWRKIWISFAAKIQSTKIRGLTHEVYIYETFDWNPIKYDKRNCYKCFKL